MVHLSIERYAKNPAGPGVLGYHTEVLGRFQVDRFSVQNYDSDELQVHIHSDGEIEIVIVKEAE